MYGFVLWLPSIIRSGGENMGMVEVGWLSSVPYLAATIAMIVVSWASDKMQNRKLVRLAAAADWRTGLHRLLGGRRQPLLGVLYPAGGGRCGNVCALRPLLRHYSGNAAAQCRRGRHGADQQYGRPGLLLRLVVCRLPERCHRQPRSLLYFYGGGAFRLSIADFDC